MSIVAIVGRPNVGKSTLFNRIIGKRKALVSDLPGVTRDRHYGHADWCGVEFAIVDTGGLSFDEDDSVQTKVHKQSMEALDEASVVVCLFDGREGITAMDRDIVEIFRKKGKRVIYVVNKIDNERNEQLAAEFNSFGIDVIPVSAEHGRNVDLVLDKVIELIPASVKKPDAEGTRVALVGRPNVGKSTIINYLAREERVVAHELPGTTRDSIDVEIVFKERQYIFVDTAGIKKKVQTQTKLDKFATLKSLKAVEKADIVFVVLDAEEGITRQDMTLIAHSYSSYKATAILVNKWDKVDENEAKYKKCLNENLKELQGLPILCISGKSGYNCNRIFGLSDALCESMKKRVTTSRLNRFFEEVVRTHPSPDWHGKQVKLYYITQVDSVPPVFVIFTNHPEGIKTSYRRYLVNGLKRLLGEPIVPIVVKFRLR